MMDSQSLISFDLRYEKEQVVHPRVKGKVLNKKNENFADKILECISTDTTSKL